MPKEEEKKFEFRSRYIFLIAFLVMLLLSLFTHDAKDLDIVDGGVDGIVNNCFGIVGANIAKYLFLYLGVAAYVIVPFLILCLIRQFLPYPLEKKRGYFRAIVCAIVGVTLLCAMFPTIFGLLCEELGLGSIPFVKDSLSGGLIAQFFVGPKTAAVSAGLIRHYIGDTGTLIVSILFFLSGIIWIWILDWHLIAKQIVKKIVEWNKQRIENKKDNDDTEIDKEPKEKIVDKIKNILPLSKKSEDEEVVQDSLDLGTSPKDEIFQPEITRYNKPDTLNNKRKYSTATTEYEDFVLPQSKMLSTTPIQAGEQDSDIAKSSLKLQQTLNDFKVAGEVINVVTGPRISRYEIALEPGIKVQRVTGLESNIAMELAAKSIRIQAPIPGKSAVGVEIPNSVSTPVGFRELLETSEFRKSKAEIPVVLGKDISGKPIILDLAKAPHLLIAGATGSGKSVCMNTLVMSLLFNFSPEDLRMIMVDPKVVEMEMYKTLPHLISPVVNESNKVPLALRWGVNEMERRYKVLAASQVKNLKGFNERKNKNTGQKDHEGKPIPKKMPYVIIIVDELADVMMTDAAKEVEMSIARIAQKGRAAGIHVVIATQRPDVKIITGVIKANLPTRIAFRVGSGIDSRVILDQMGAEKLLGQGDMLFIAPGGSEAERLQGAWVPDEDIMGTVKYVSDQADQHFDSQVLSEEDDEELVATQGKSKKFEIKEPPVENSPISISADYEENPVLNSVMAKYLQPNDDENFKRALEIVITERKASTSYFQRRLKIGYNKGAEIVDEMENRGIISPPLAGGSKREVLITDMVEKG